MSASLKKESRAKLKQILEKYRYDKAQLVSILQDTQAEFRYLPEDILDGVSHMLGVPLSQVYSVATFFRAFTLVPRGKHLISACMGTACHVRGALKVLEKIERDLGIAPGQTTKDLVFTLETVNCVGACATGPIVIVDGKYEGQMTTEKVPDMLQKYA